MKFSEWLNQQDIALCQWESVGEGADHHHVLMPFEPEGTDIILERYLRNILKIYGDMPAACTSCDGDHQCGACGGKSDNCIWCHKP